MSASSATDAPPLAKYLASTDKKVRDKAVQNLAIFLSNDSENAISELEMAKLWKGIFYCFWMSDKPLVQQALASELAGLVLTITSTPSALKFLRGFWLMTVREWSGIDRLRMDKYYMLVRRFTNASFRLLIRAEWDNDTCKEYNSILIESGGPLCPSDIRVPSSLPFHLADVYLEELEKAMTSSSSSHPAPLYTLVFPFFNLAARTPTTKTTYKHIQETVFDPLFIALKQTRSEDPPSRKKLRPTSTYPTLITNACLSSSKEEKTSQDSPLRKALLQKMFTIASEEGTRDANRRKMYAFYKDAVEDDDSSDGQ